jgi:hypothetical protein
MKKEKKQTVGAEKQRPLTLKGYYLGLPKPTFPKREFVDGIARECNVSTTTVRNWIMYGFKPENVEHIRVLSRFSGIPMNELWIE